MIKIQDPRALFNAVFGIDGVRQNPPGTVIEYWRGVTDVEPTGKRGEVFREAMRLYDLGRVLLYQVKCDEGYSYRARVL